MDGSAPIAPPTRQLEAPRCKRTWSLYGNCYDLSSFLEHHPGGRMILETARGEHDITPLFESYHQMGDLTAIQGRLAHYLVEEGCYTPKYTFDASGFYRTLAGRIREHFIAKHLLDPHATKSVLPYIKADAAWYSACIATMVACGLSYWLTFATSSTPPYILPVSAFLTGYLYTNIGFIVMHDASHHALFRNQRLNACASYVWHAIALWNDRIWQKHHIVLHHAFTGDARYDPDVSHFRPILRKRPPTGASKTVLYDRFKYLHPLFYLMILPGMFVGQVVSYALFHVRRRMWNMDYPIETGLCTRWYDALFLAPACYAFAHTSWAMFLCFMVGLNVCYANCIIGDHDTFETHANANDEATDWGEVQVRNSGNFMNQSPFEWFSRLHGGINYQIEHHLFPSMCHSHYPAISVVVRQTCREFNIPYAHHARLVDVYRSFLKLVQCSTIESTPAIA
jgi:linoleoyl-CoA desaturase